MSADTNPQLSVVILTLNEESNIAPLLDRLKKTINELGVSSEVIVVDGGSQDQTRDVAVRGGARCIIQTQPGYARALLEGLAAATGDFILTLDADLSHPPEMLREMWSVRHDADIIIGSRFTRGGSSEAPLLRQWFSCALNKFFSLGLSVPVKDSSSGFRLYQRGALCLGEFGPENFSVLQEVLIRAFSSGFTAKEVPLRYLERATGSSHVQLIPFSLSYLPTFYRLWKLRNLVSTADYEYRAYWSRHLLQRYWIRRRLKTIREFLGAPARVLDVGSGSNYLATILPGLVAVDNEPQKIRLLSRLGVKVTEADCHNLPFSDGSFDQVILSQILPYVRDVRQAIREAHRVLRPGGLAVVCVPDSRSIGWRIFGSLYGALPNVRASRRGVVNEFSKDSLEACLAEQGFRPLRHRYICGAELVILLQRDGDTSMSQAGELL